MRTKQKTCDGSFGCSRIHGRRLIPCLDPCLSVLLLPLVASTSTTTTTVTQALEDRALRDKSPIIAVPRTRGSQPVGRQDARLPSRPLSLSPTAVERCVDRYSISGQEPGCSPVSTRRPPRLLIGVSCKKYGEVATSAKRAGRQAGKQARHDRE